MNKNRDKKMVKIFLNRCSPSPNWILADWQFGQCIMGSFWWAARSAVACSAFDSSTISWIPAPRSPFKWGSIWLFNSFVRKQGIPCSWSRSFARLASMGWLKVFRMMLANEIVFSEPKLVVFFDGIGDPETGQGQIKNKKTIPPCAVIRYENQWKFFIKFRQFT